MMQYRTVGRFLTTAVVVLALTTRLAAAATSEPTAPSRIVGSIELGDTVTLAGNTHPSAKSSTDQGLVPGEQQLAHMFIALRRSPSQQRALARFNARQLDAASPDYHHWLQPHEFGMAYGPNDADIAAVTGWLESTGLQVHKVSEGRITVEFSGTASQVQKAFGVEMHRYLANGATSIANDRDPQIPRAVSPVVAGIVGLNTFPLKGDKPPGNLMRTTAAAHSDAEGGPAPQLSVTDAGESFTFMTPLDFATIYNSLPLWNASKPIVGTGVTIAIVGDNDVNLADIATYRSTLGLPVNVPSIQYVGANPAGSSKMSTTQLELAGAAAPAAHLILVVPAGGLTLPSLLSAVSYIMDKNLAPIVEFGYGDCELLLGTSSNAMINSLWQQGATQGMSILVAAGDQGSAGCNGLSGTDGGGGLAVNGLASSPFVTAVGGTDFAWQWAPSSFSTYWNTPSTPIQSESAKGYIPEVPWNTTCTNALLQQNQGYLYYDLTGTSHLSYPYATTQDLCNANENNFNYFTLLNSSAGGGGFSHCTALDTSGKCQAGSGYTKPPWQRVAGVPADGKRDVPDVSLFASPGWPDHEGDGGAVPYLPPLIPGTAILVCFDSSTHPCTYANGFTVDNTSIGYQTSGGTALAAAYWAGIVALVEQNQSGVRQGLVNPTLYSLFSGQNLFNCLSGPTTAGSACVFHDVFDSVTNGTACVAGSSPDCYVIPGTQGEYETVYGILDGYTAGIGYDQTTGLGSVNITNLVNKWSTASSLPPARASSVAMGALVDYLGDGRSDFSVWRPSSGNFYFADQQQVLTFTQWGLSTDVPVVGDFDGDGVTDTAVWRPSNGTWYITYSSTGQVVTKQWGVATDVPVVGDFDGDGKTDIAVWRPATGYWYIIQSSNGATVSKQWGAPTDVPVAGDFDGDGKTDIAVWRPATGYWYINQSSNGATVAKQWGTSTDMPVFGDFDGDGKTDIAVWRPATGYWYINQSSNGAVVSTPWGQKGDVPVPSDYNGSGITNIAVWRPANGTWYVYEGGSTQPLVQQWGAATDLLMEQKAQR